MLPVAGNRWKYEQIILVYSGEKTTIVLKCSCVLCVRIDSIILF
jgi:hypothetical protein